MNKIHIGELIKTEVKKQNLSNAEFGRRINTSGSNVRDIYIRSSIDTNKLIEISEVLSCNFFKYFSEQAKVEKKSPNKIKVMVELEFDKDDLMKQIKANL